MMTGWSQHVFCCHIKIWFIHFGTDVFCYKILYRQILPTYNCRSGISMQTPATQPQDRPRVFWISFSRRKYQEKQHVPHQQPQKSPLWLTYRSPKTSPYLTNEPKIRSLSLNFTPPKDTHYSSVFFHFHTKSSVQLSLLLVLPYLAVTFLSQPLTFHRPEQCGISVTRPLLSRLFSHFSAKTMSNKWTFSNTDACKLAILKVLWHLNKNSLISDVLNT